MFFLEAKFQITNKSSGPSISIDLNPSIEYGDWMGMILCVLFRAKPSDRFYCRMNYLGDICEVATVRCPINSKSSNHIWLFYLPKDLMPIEWQNSSQCLEVSFHAITTSCNFDSSGCGPCGFLLVYENDIQELNKIISQFRNQPAPQNERNEPFSNLRDEDSLSLHRTNSLSAMRVKLAENSWNALRNRQEDLDD
ncbi:hypothetical protein FNV43_RR01744 [Rhamnella rubrinervis]|uniref:Uncharacterized protein n=1 Tax=Rhamnella rubrinervis TaxID=2594499 RepID=A0A8K0MSK7_9ROSA|nr:hypothetical protein FNV43_RR01744 [Rhamnella rubrinervis]